MRLPNPQPARSPSLPSSGCAGFTLLEVILAISIAVGILVVALVFHHQASVLRKNLLEESEKLAAVRQLMDRMALELRSVPVNRHQWFTGTASSLRFVACSVPQQTNSPESDLKAITYTATYWEDEVDYGMALVGAPEPVGSEAGLTVSGMTRIESPMIDFSASVLPDALATADALADAFGVEPDVSVEGVVVPTGTASTNLLVSGSGPGTNAIPGRMSRPLTEAIHFVRFRYWDGLGWREEWGSAQPPAAVEITFGLEAIPPEMTAEKYPYEIFRRVVCVPSGATGVASAG